MPVKSNVLMILGIIAFFGLGFIFLLYFTVKTKTTSLDQIQPFLKQLHQPYPLQKDVYLFRELNLMTGELPITMMEESHPLFQWFRDRSDLPEPETEILEMIPAGTLVTFGSSKVFTGGVSGTSDAFLFGNLSHEGKTYNFQYEWGEQSFSRVYDHEKKTWSFWQAPWQTAQDTGYYEVPKAEWW